MRVSTLLRGATLTLAAVAATVVTAVPPASATPVTGGTVTVTIPFPVTVGFLTKGVVICGSDWSATVAQDGTITATTAVTGGDMNLAEFLGFVTLPGTLTFQKGARKVVLSNLMVDINNFQVIGTTGDGTQVSVAELTDIQADSLTHLQALQLPLTASGSAYLNNKLRTNAFAPGTSLGSLDLTFTV